MKKITNCAKTFLFTLLTVLMFVCGTQPVSAASRYGEENPLRVVRTGTVTVGSGHTHKYIDAGNGVRYFLYDSCMNGMTGSVPTNHLSTVTIGGVKYSLRNYKGKNGGYANVIRQTGSAGSSTGPKSIALTKIALNKSSVSLTAGSSVKLTVSYTPSNTTASKTVTWTSSNKAVAAVSGGTVTAKKAGTAVITAKVGSKTAVCKVTVKAKTGTANNKPGTGSSNPGGTSSGDGIVIEQAGRMLSVSEAYTLLNKFRTNSANQWYWNSNNTAKIRTGALSALRRDPQLETIAKERAIEQWQQYYVRGRATHDRLNGSSCWTAYPASVRAGAENLAWGQTSCSQVINVSWAETNQPYSKQGHRRNMLSSSYTRVGIACYSCQGKTCWAMCLGF